MPDHFEANETVRHIADSAEKNISDVLTTTRATCAQMGVSEFETLSVITRDFAKLMFARLSEAKKKEGYDGLPDPARFIQACMDGVEDCLIEQGDEG